MLLSLFSTLSLDLKPICGIILPVKTDFGEVIRQVYLQTGF